jgi:hypothetical protein
MCIEIVYHLFPVPRSLLPFKSSTGHDIIHINSAHLRNHEKHPDPIGGNEYLSPGTYERT